MQLSIVMLKSFELAFIRTAATWLVYVGNKTASYKTLGLPRICLQTVLNIIGLVFERYVL